MCETKYGLTPVIYFFKTGKSFHVERNKWVQKHAPTTLLRHSSNRGAKHVSQ